MPLYPVINQKFGVIGEGDIDDCFAVATIWAAQGADRCARKPTIPEFRQKAGNPDDPNRSDGGNLTQIEKAVPLIWPTAKFIALRSKTWSALMSRLTRGDHVSIAVNSAHLPANLRFGFYGPHQVGIVKHKGVIYCANPLAKNGSAPVPISESALKYAVTTVASGWILAACFGPIPVHLRYDATMTVPFPDRTRAHHPNGGRIYYRSRPDRINKADVLGRIPEGELWIAYQRTEGALVRGSRTWYGDHRGTKWVHSTRLAHEGGIS